MKAAEKPLTDLTVATACLNYCTAMMRFSEASESPERAAIWKHLRELADNRYTAIFNMVCSDAEEALK